ncbi:malonic semialdehyde reductase [Actinotalea sp. M2MS4P-6]|uniref:malonic semialdehyde reductase n=1 Tax=Actinotalea sp. M2MS4P-6 TaxID=2983762 RepID=UPI0021E41070|nr:malonic semialdehyde reductase [Actinotalea sp. M2MS4P-6]MCV2395514.1 malonic semialdehyde reductase [Actinotalea sp. M2MS4P-6]
MTQTTQLDTLTDLGALAPLFLDRRTAREWSDEAVPDALVASVYDTVRWGPTLMNTSPLRLLLVRTDEARERLVDHMNDGNKARVRNAPLTILVAADTAFHEHMDVLAPHVPQAGERFATNPGRERLAREQAWLQAGYLVTALRAAGLDVGPMSGMDAAGIDADLLTGTAWQSLMVLNVGYPAPEDSAFPRAPRLAVDEAVRVA